MNAVAQPTKQIITPASVAGLVIPPLGAYWEGQGGFNAGPIRGEKGNPDHYVIAIPPAIVKKIGRVEFGNYRGPIVEGADNRRDGLANTLAQINSGIAHPAAEACRAIESDGHTDIYLAAQGEASLVYHNTHDDELTDTRWCSTQDVENAAWVQLFSRNGNQSIGYRNDEFLVCPVRRLVI